MNSTFLVDFGNGHDFAIRCMECRLSAVCGQQQLVTGRNLDIPPFKDVKRLSLFRRDRCLLAAGVTHDDLLVFHLDHFNRFVLCNSLNCSMKRKKLTRAKVADIGPLSCRPAQGNVSRNGNALA